jgi:hypothetical protein
MELLIRNGRIGLVVGALALACHPFGSGGGEGGERAELSTRFPHATHVLEQGMDCSDCHVSVAESDDPGMPAPMLCDLCHEGLDEEKPAGERVADLLESGVIEAVHRTALGDEVLFSHLAHVNADLECTACHGPIDESLGMPAEVRVPMQECMACHESRGLSTDCATCHREIRADRPPPSHGQLWHMVHGEVARDDGAASCTLCHEESSCSSCHRDEAPRNHNQFWRRAGHGQSAAFDRQSCATCHDRDSCSTCHAEARPSTHRAGWGGVRNEHCVSCHFPLRAEGCVTCHADADAHLTAPPRPPTHFPGMDCRQCHGLTAPLPHVDDGSDCTVCHP